ncbi:MAG: tetratricopeptide repeat protein [Bacteroidaceae bacterium]|nr:tetratricopeptide repeat protein [Bacteroidaceae bacterium]
MKKILLITLSLLISATGMAQDTLYNDSVLEKVDSVQQEAVKRNFTNEKISDFTKSDGDTAYIKKDYASAIQIYENLLKKGESADIYYNLGNSYYKLNNIAKAILNYRRALLLEPGNSDIRANLDIAHSKTVDKVDSIPDVFFVSWIKSLINCFSVGVWAKIGILFFLLFIVALYFYVFSKRTFLKKIGFFAALFFIIITVFANVFASNEKERLLSHDSAIVMDPSITVRSTPSESGTDLFILHEGHEVKIKDNSMKAWKEIRLEDGKVGWVPTSSIEVI